MIDFIGPTPKIKPGSDVHDIVQVCKGFLRQGHVQVNYFVLLMYKYCSHMFVDVVLRSCKFRR